MSADIISLRGYRDLQSVDLLARQRLHACLIVHIEALLDELEELAADTGAWPPVLLARTSATIANARRLLASWERLPPAAAPQEDDEGDPQPEIDRELLERLYRDLTT